MVLKLIKHEIKFLGKYLMLIWAGLILMIVSQRILTNYINSDNYILRVFAMNSAPLLMLSLFALYMVTYVVIIIRFYKSMFTGEGYLTFTLPVKTGQLVFSKLITGVLFMLVPSAVMVLVMFSYFTNYEIWTVAVDIAKAFYRVGLETPLLLIWGLMLLVGMFAMFTELYLGMSLGQMANRNKIIYSILSVFGIRMVKQVVNGIIFVTMAILTSNGLQMVEDTGMIYLFSITALIVVTMSTIVEWILTVYICKNKLNLE